MKKQIKELQRRIRKLEEQYIGLLVHLKLSAECFADHITIKSHAAKKLQRKNEKAKE